MKIKIPLYQTSVFVFFSEEHWKEHSGEDRDENCYGFCEDRKYGADIVFFEKRNSTIAHEAVHAAWACLAVSGITVDRKNQEPLAYIVGYIVEQIYKGYERYEQKTAQAEKQAVIADIAAGTADRPSNRAEPEDKPATGE